MTKNRDAKFIAEAYQKITAPYEINESINLDPEDWNIIAHALAVVGGAAAAAVKQKIAANKQAREDKFNLSGTSTATKLDAQGNPADPYEMNNASVSPELQRAKSELNKGKTKI